MDYRSAGPTPFFWMAIITCVSFSQSLWAENDWSPWRTVEHNISMRVKIGKFRYDGGELQHSYQFRNDNDAPASFQYELHFTSRGKQSKETGTLRLDPKAESNTSGSWVICDPAAGFW